MKIIKVISFLPVTVRKIKDEQINKETMRAPLWGSQKQETRLLTFMFVIKRKKRWKKHQYHCYKTNKQTN